MTTRNFYWIVDDRGGDIFCEKLRTTCEEIAIREAQSEFDRLSSHDLKKCVSFYLALAPEVCEVGERLSDTMDFDNTEIVLKLK